MCYVQRSGSRGEVFMIVTCQAATMFCILWWTFGPVEPSPATHAILTVLKGGRKRVSDVLLAKNSV